LTKKSILASLIIVLLLTSGPFYIPLALATSNIPSEGNTTSPQIPAANSTTPIDTASNQTEPTPPYEKPVIPRLQVNASTTSGDSPIFVRFTGIANIHPFRVLQYRWDFDGDGLIDHASQTTGNASHVYVVNSPTTYTATLTIEYTDGTMIHESVTIDVDPVNRDDWHQIKDLGSTVFAFNKNGTIYIFDESSWIPLNFFKAGNLVQNPSFRKIDSSNSKLTYNTGDRLLEVGVRFGITGRALFNFVEYHPSGLEVSPQNREITLPLKISSGSLNFHYNPRSKKNTEANVEEFFSNISPDGALSYAMFRDSTSQLRTDDGLYLHNDPELFFTSGGGGSGIFAEGGGVHDPWNDQGLTPYGEYFSNLQESISAQTGFLTITQTDLVIPGRGLDLAIRRVYAPPIALNNATNLPASDIDYSYQDYPLARMGNGWQLGFPWIETNNSEPAYIHLSNGQRYAVNGTSLNTTIQSGDYFKIENHTNGYYSLYTIDGTRYFFNETVNKTYLLMNITDTNGNNLTFAYDVNHNISRITDTIGRNVTFAYGGSGLLSSITSGSRTINYSYSGSKLTEVKDPANRTTKFEYLNDYIINKTEYPTGGYSDYYYSTYTNSSNVKYRVNNKRVYESSSSLASNSTYSYGGDFFEVDNTTLKVYDGSTVNKTTVLEYSQESFSEEVWDGNTTDPRISKTSKTFTVNTRRRTHIQWFPGDSQNSVNKTMTYDNWGNVVYVKDYIGHEKYYSFINTNTSDTFVNGEQNYGFTDAFYSNSVDENIHNSVVGSVEYQDGVGSSAIESYFEYSSEGLLTETKRLLQGQWLKTRYTYDDYGNMRKITDANTNSVYMEYNSTYSQAYLTSMNQITRWEDGYESGDFTAWDLNFSSPGGINEVQSSTVNDGSFAAHFKTDDATEYAHSKKTFSGKEWMMVGFYIRVTDLPAVGNLQYYYLLTDVYNRWVSYIGLVNDGGTYKLRGAVEPELACWDAVVQVDSSDWYYIEVDVGRGDSDGSLRVSFEGEEVIYATGIDTNYGSLGFYGNTYFGINGGNDPTSEVYIDGAWASDDILTKKFGYTDSTGDLVSVVDVRVTGLIILMMFSEGSQMSRFRLLMGIGLGKQRYTMIRRAQWRSTMRMETRS